MAKLSDFTEGDEVRIKGAEPEGIIKGVLSQESRSLVGQKGRIYKVDNSNQMVGVAAGGREEFFDPWDLEIIKTKS